MVLISNQTKSKVFPCWLLTWKCCVVVVGGRLEGDSLLVRVSSPGALRSFSTIPCSKIFSPTEIFSAAVKDFPAKFPKYFLFIVLYFQLQLKIF